MKVLWFTTDIPDIYQKKSSYNGGGWIRSLLYSFSQYNPDISIGFAFPCYIDKNISIDKNITYIPLRATKTSKIDKLKKYWGITKKNEYFLCKQEAVECIKKFKPDIIQIFGIEHGLASIVELTNIPTVVHLQGLLNPYNNAFYPPEFNKLSCLIYGNIIREYIIRNGLIYKKKNIKDGAKKEKRRFKHVKYIMGRTDWDHEISSLYSPQAQYFKINECLRPEFLETNYKQHNIDKNNIILVSTISETFYKGFDTILKTAQVLKDDLNINFHWHIIGLNGNSPFIRIFEKQCGIYSKNYPIVFKGVLNSVALKKELSNSDIFIHPSYIDNSPNSVCEAQVSGIPVIATNVGGISSLIEQNKTGLLVPSNAPHEIAYFVIKLANNDEFRNNIIKKAMETAKERHNPKKICSDILEAYKCIINKI